ncbi:MAG: hypothetical protein ACRD9L_14790, partial [Bryobacteraceae bacterium]
MLSHDRKGAVVAKGHGYFLTGPNAMWSMWLCAAMLAIAAALPAQTPAPKPVIGTVTGFNAGSSEIDIKHDNGETAQVKFGSETHVSRVAPGEKDLRKAEPIKVTDIAVGDRVLAAFAAGTTEARRILVMTATDIAERNEADRLDWTKRGLAGVVTAKNGNEITLHAKSLQADVVKTVTVTDKTTYRRYAPDSVKFAEAKPSGLAEINPGDQLRARGQKSEDGTKVTADEVVFGTFLTNGGTITAVNPAAKEITIAELRTKKPLVIRLTADSQLKTMPDFAGMAGRGAAGAGHPGGAGAGGEHRGGMDIAQMLERMPPAKLEDLKVGETVIVSSTKGAKPDEVTAITLLANADRLIQMATRQSGEGRP